MRLGQDLPQLLTSSMLFVVIQLLQNCRHQRIRTSILECFYFGFVYFSCLFGFLLNCFQFIYFLIRYVNYASNLSTSSLFHQLQEILSLPSKLVEVRASRGSCSFRDIFLLCFAFLLKLITFFIRLIVILVKHLYILSNKFQNFKK